MSNGVIEPSRRRIVTLVGMMGSGKSTTGWKLSERLGLKLLDMDREIEKIEKQTVAEIFEEKGEEHFRKAERELLGELVSSEKPMILSTGGETFLNKENRELIKNKTVSIWLRADIETLHERVSRRNTRPLLETGEDKRDIIERMCAEYYPVYEEADIHIDTDGLSHSQVVTILVERLTRFIRGEF